MSKTRYFCLAHCAPTLTVFHKNFMEKRLFPPPVFCLWIGVFKPQDGNFVLIRLGSCSVGEDSLHTR